MGMSYFGQEEYVISHYRERNIGNGHLLTNDYGSWVFLNPQEYKHFKTGDIKEPLLSMLKEKRLILTKENMEQAISEHREKCGYLFQGTSLHIIIPTLRCNLKCVYCHAKARPAKARGYALSKETARKTVDFILQTPSKPISIEFQGGEPLLRFDLVKYIVEYAKKENKRYDKDIQFTLVTNLVDMSDDKLEFIRKHGIGICTSLDGHKLVHNKNRQEYDKTIKWIKKILKVYTINAMLLATRHTLPYPIEIVDEYFKLGLPRIWIKPVNKLAFAEDNWKRIGIEADKYLEFWKKALDRIIKMNRERMFIENYTRIVLRKILTKECVNFTDLESPCGAAIGQLAYNYDGSIHTCDEGRLYEIFKLGTVDDKYKDVVTSQGACGVVKASINDNPVCEICAYKPICGLCPVCSYAETGNIISDLPDRRCRILIGMFDHIFDKLLHDKEYREVFMSWIEN